MAGLLDSLFGDLQGTSAGGLLGLLGGGGGIGTATRRLRTPEEEQQAAALYGGNLNLPSQIPTGFPAGTPQAPPQDYVGTPGALDPKWQALLAGNTDPYQPNAQLPPTATPTAGAQNGHGVPQAGVGGGGQPAEQNPLMGLLGGIGNLFGTSSAQAAPAPGTAQQPGIPAQAAAGPAAGPGLFGRLQAGATNLSSGGNPLAGLINAVGGLATGERTDRQGIALQNQAATQRAYEQSLVANGIPLQQARPLAIAASVNAEAAKTLSPYLLTKPKWDVIGKDVLGHEQYGWTNPINESVKVPNVTGPGVGAGVGGAGLPQNIDPQVWGQMLPEERLAKMPPSVQGELQAIHDGRQSSTGRNIQTLMPLVNQVWPDFTAQTYKQIADGRKDWYGGGASQQTVKNVRQFVGHTTSLMDSIDNQGNWGGIGTSFNQPAAAIKGAFGGTGQNPVTTKAHAAADELAGIFKGLKISDAEIQAWKKSFREFGSPAQQREDVGTLFDLASHSIDALEQKRVDTFGPELAAKLPPILDPKTEALLTGIKQWAAGGSATQQGAAGQQQAAPANVQEGATATNPKTGQRIIYKGGQWQPMK